MFVASCFAHSSSTVAKIASDCDTRSNLKQYLIIAKNLSAYVANKTMLKKKYNSV